ncbi:MAG: MFS transporter [Candidatus Lokiarchaeota archaeon]|nr:MFS transporter [Candidatus Lokiarchaeota archaeon]
MSDEKKDIIRIKILIFLVYLVEGFIAYAIYNALSYYLGYVLGINSILIGIVGSIGIIPFLLKIVIAPLTDKYSLPIFSDKKKSYLFIGIIFNGIFLALFSIDILNFFVFFAIIFFLQSLGFVIMDVTVDSLAVLIKKDSHDVSISIVMFLGTLVGGALVFFVIGVFQYSYGLGFIIVGILSLCLLPVIFFMKLPPNLNESTDVNFGEIRVIFKEKKFQLIIIFAFLFNIDGGLLEFTLEPYLGRAFGASLVDVGILYIISFLSSIIGIILLYIYRNKLNKFKLFIFISYYMAFMSLTLCIAIFTSLVSFQLFLFIYILMGILSGVANMTLYAIFIEASSPKLAATSFIFLITFLNFGFLIGVLFSGFIHIGVIYLISAIIMATRTIILFKLIKIKEN